MSENKEITGSFSALLYPKPSNGLKKCPDLHKLPA